MRWGGLRPLRMERVRVWGNSRRPSGMPHTWCSVGVYPQGQARPRVPCVSRKAAASPDMKGEPLGMCCRSGPSQW